MRCFRAFFPNFFPEVYILFFLRKKKRKKKTSDEMKSVTLHYFTTERFTGNFLS